MKQIARTVLTLALAALVATSAFADDAQKK